MIVADRPVFRLAEQNPAYVHLHRFAPNARMQKSEDFLAFCLYFLILASEERGDE